MKQFIKNKEHLRLKVRLSNRCKGETIESAQLFKKNKQISFHSILLIKYFNIEKIYVSIKIIYYKLRSSYGTAIFYTSYGTVGFLSKMDVTTIELTITLLYDCLSLCFERTYVYCKCSNR